MVEFRDQINQLLQQPHSYLNWAAILNFIDENRTETINSSPELKNKIYTKLEYYRLEFPDQPIRREDINPKIYNTLEIEPARSRGHKLAIVHLAI